MGLLVRMLTIRYWPRSRVLILAWRAGIPPWRWLYLELAPDDPVPLAKWFRQPGWDWTRRRALGAAEGFRAARASATAVVEAERDRVAGGWLDAFRIDGESDHVTQRAVDAVARRVLARAVERALDLTPEQYVDWGDYPDIGAWDWERVQDRVRLLAQRVDVQEEHYQPAYRHLAGRAGTGDHDV